MTGLIGIAVGGLVGSLVGDVVGNKDRWLVGLALGDNRGVGLRAVGLELGELRGLAVGECFSGGLLSEPAEDMPRPYSDSPLNSFARHTADLYYLERSFNPTVDAERYRQSCMLWLAGC